MKGLPHLEAESRRRKEEVSRICERNTHDTLYAVFPGTQAPRVPGEHISDLTEDSRSRISLPAAPGAHRRRARNNVCFLAQMASTWRAEEAGAS